VIRLDESVSVPLAGKTASMILVIGDDGPWAATRPTAFTGSPYSSQVDTLVGGPSFEGCPRDPSPRRP
jgi:hypothetical protein